MVLDGNDLSKKIKNSVKENIKELMIKPCLAIIQIGNNSISNLHINKIKETCNEVGIYVKHIKYDEYTIEKEIINKIIELNNDKYVDGIMLELPIIEKYNVKKLVNFITKNKDIDGLTDSNKASLLRNNSNLVSCSALAVIELLKEYNIEIEGKNIVVIGRSNLVGMPTAILLNNMDATVTLCHSKTKNLINHTKNADIIISATGIPNLITKDMVNKNSVVIDVGFTKLNDKYVGDVDFENIKDNVKYISSINNGVGVVTNAILLRNILLANKKRNK